LGWRFKMVRLDGWAYACARKTTPTRLRRLTRNAMLCFVDFVVFLFLMDNRGSCTLHVILEVGAGLLPLSHATFLPTNT